MKRPFVDFIFGLLVLCCTGLLIASLAALVNASPETEEVSLDPAADSLVHLPVVKRPLPTSTPTNTPQPTHTPTASPTPSATATQPPAASGDVRMTYIFYNGAGSREPDEYVEIQNFDSRTLQLSGWTLRDAANHVYTFPSYLMQPGEVCRVYTNENHPEWCGFNYGSGSAIWNNSGDTATLQDATAHIVDTCAYSGGGSGTSCP